ncbi:MAG: MotA/TolQ/ExbB proton channel family protein [Gammaproteobacteria bacterium]
MIDASSFPAVAATLWTLGAFSVATWGLIAVKGVQHLRVKRGNSRYARAFGGSPSLQAASEIKNVDAPLSRLAASGFSVLRSQGGGHEADLEHAWDRHDLLERNLRQHIHKERRGLEAGLAVLGSVGSTAPFVGLFGTVWGIMSAMKDISRLGNASIDVVAGPIGEALIATGIGIAVAIPAVLAYNFFVRRLKAVTADLDDFAHDFVNLAQRAGYRVERSIRPVESRPREVVERVAHSTGVA